MTKSDPSLEILNQAKDLLVKFANENNINLREHFDSVADFKEFVIGFTYRFMVEQMNIPSAQAFDLVMGEGAFENLYETLRVS